MIAFVDFGSDVDRWFLHAMRMWIAIFSNSGVADKLSDRLHSRKKKRAELVSVYDWVVLWFDMTLGFPGEGPERSKTWSLISSNVGSLLTNKTWKSWTDDVLCLQETRIGRNNAKSAKFEASSLGKELFLGELLPGLITSHGYRRIGHGGVAIVSPGPLTKPFLPSDDATGNFKELFASKRVSGCWIQVHPTVRALVFSIYAQTAAASDPSIHDYNNKFFDKLFEISSQFGDIPVLFTGDFQDEPSSYASIAHALHFKGWCDPLVKADSRGQLHRDITFSNDRSFSGAFEGCSSIDAILTNRVATAALQSVEILQTFHSQHRPIRAVFSWPRIFQKGCVLKMPAPFVLPSEVKSSLKSGYAEGIASTLWEEEFESHFHATSDANEQWDIANQLAIRTLLQSGAIWSAGEKSRGEPPKFLSKKLCPGQLPSGQATSLTMSWRLNALRCTHALQCRFSRVQYAGQDFCDSLLTCARLRRRLALLGYPSIWPVRTIPSLNDLFQCEAWLLKQISISDFKLKWKRIEAWKLSVRSSAKSSAKFVYKHLRNKIRDEPANLVEDSNGNIIFDPEKALQTINERWDDVFAANVLHQEPTQMLHTIWPYIHDFSQRADIPEIAAEHLMHTVQVRNPDASPGLDGWRTRELQSLPITCFKPFALVFQQLECDERELPDTLTRAKQLILNKNGSSDAMQKRLITVLPIMLLAYSGARFRHLQDWQSSFLPKELFGGIRGRHMAHVHNGLQLELDHARSQGAPLVGVKLDKSKCFDRIVPSFAGALMLSFGIPKGVIAVFLKLYAKLNRYLSYKSWMSQSATHAPNGVAQGCSLSLIAINMYMCAWVLMIRRLPSLTARVFIDDSYLWTSLANRQVLCDAISVTKLWDDLSGQKLNLDKCTVWGSDTASRRAVKLLFPQMHFAASFDVLGTLIVTDNKPATHLTEEKINKILADTKNVGALPLCMPEKTKLLGGKVLPQITFGACINLIPKVSLKQLSSGVAAALWKNRPHWRSNLVIGLLSKPHRVDVVLSRAYCTLLDFIRYVKAVPHAVAMCKQLFLDIPKTKHSLMRNVVEAANVFGLSICQDLCFSFHGSQPIAALDLNPHDLKTLLQSLARNASYHTAQTRVRKDFSKPVGMLDHGLTRAVLPKITNQTVGKLPVSALFDSVQTGCLLTNDRLCAAGLVDSPSCRFCNTSKESAHHLVHECEIVRRMIGAPHLHELGPNFALLGIVEHPLGLVKSRLKMSLPETLHCNPIRVSDVTQPLWTDGSVFASDLYWITTGGFAIIDLAGNCIASGQVWHWSLCSYTTELWAIIVAATFADSSVHIFTDNQAVAKNFAELLQLRVVPSHWSHHSWWVFLLDLCCSKFESCGAMIEVTWVPAHRLERIPCQMITEDLARAAGSTILDIERNRQADFAARDITFQCSPIDPSWLKALPVAIVKHQMWLIELAKLLHQENEADVVNRFVPAQNPEPEIDDDFIRGFFTAWSWPPLHKGPFWKPKPSSPSPMPSKWSLHHDCWGVFLAFLSGLKWRLDPLASWSYLELAGIFILRGFRFPNVDHQVETFRTFIPLIKKAALCVIRGDGDSLLPGKHNPDRNKAVGKTLPSGTLDGVELRCTSDELLALGHFLIDGGNHRLSSWEFCLCDLN